MAATTLNPIPTGISAYVGEDGKTAGSYAPAAKHTPGPWKWDGHSLVPATRDPQQHAVHTIMVAEYFAWGFVCADRDAVGREDNANRALIETAPELLKAAQLVYRDMSTKGEISPVAWELLAAAIDKATGAA